MLFREYDFGVFYDSTLSFAVSQFEFERPSHSEDLTNGSWASTLDSNFIYANRSKLSQESNFGSGFFLDTNFTFTSQLDGPQTVLFGSFYNSKVTLWNCLLYLNTRNITTECLDGTSVEDSLPAYVCSITSMRAPTLSTGTPFSTYDVAAQLFGQWPIVDDASTGTSSLTEQFLANG